ncbi:MAG: hypothetical protein AVDCRST_MAG89-3608, partial [uncultured Gemmatimonadetes bacterium]
MWSVGRRTVAPFLVLSALASASCDALEQNAIREMGVASRLAAETPPSRQPAPPPAPRETMPAIIRGIYVSSYA